MDSVDQLFDLVQIEAAAAAGDIESSGLQGLQTAVDEPPMRSLGIEHQDGLNAHSFKVGAADCKLGESVVRRNHLEHSDWRLRRNRLLREIAV